MNDDRSPDLPRDTTMTSHRAPRPRLPRGVWSMAFTELWERFSFYGLQGILSFYLLYALADGGLELPPAAAAGIVGAYGGAVYLAQIVGAWLGDRLVAPRDMVFWGGVVITAGHLVLAFVPGIVGLGVGLVLIVLGTGALKTNITSIVGFIVEDRSRGERDASFSYFYMAINAGAVVGPLATGLAQNELGFHWGFGLAAVGMIAALVQFAATRSRLPDRAAIVNHPLPRAKRVSALIILVCGLAAIATAWLTGLLRAEYLSSITTVLALAAAAAYFIVLLRSREVTGAERRRVLGYLPLFLAAGLYFGLLFQKFTAISILVKERVDLSVGDWTFPVAWITTASPLAAVLVTPLVARLWTSLGERQPSIPAKFAIGLFQIGAAYALLLGIIAASAGGSIPIAPILLFMAVAGSSEVFVGPIGLALATKIGPRAFTAQMVGLNFLTLALGSSLSGLLGQLFAAIDNTTYVVIVSALGIAIGVALFLARAPLGRLLDSFDGKR